MYYRHLSIDMRNFMRMNYSLQLVWCAWCIVYYHVDECKLIENSVTNPLYSIQLPWTFNSEILYWADVAVSIALTSLNLYDAHLTLLAPYNHDTDSTCSITSVIVISDAIYWYKRITRYIIIINDDLLQHPWLTTNAASSSNKNLHRTISKNLLERQSTRNSIKSAKSAKSTKSNKSNKSSKSLRSEHRRVSDDVIDSTVFEVFDYRRSPYYILLNVHVYRMTCTFIYEYIDADSYSDRVCKGGWPAARRLPPVRCLLPWPKFPDCCICAQVVVITW